MSYIFGSSYHRGPASYRIRSASLYNAFAEVGMQFYETVKIIYNQIETEVVKKIIDDDNRG